MNVYDFDETIFTGDSEDRFFKFLFNKKGFCRYKINFKWYDILFKTKLMNRTKSREGQYKFLKKIDNLDEVLNEYWRETEQYMKPWYNEVKKDDDVIASGTPAFLLEPIITKLGIKNLVATDMNPKTGKINGEFSIGEIKPKNFSKKFSLDDIDKFYSDAYSDRFLAEWANEAYVVHDNDEFTEWNEYFKAHPEKMK